MEPRIEILKQKILVGKKLDMSFSDNKTQELWKSFMPRKKEINFINELLYSVEVYPTNFYSDFDPNRKFEKWAAVEVDNFEHVPNDMESLTIPNGTYAVFKFKGPSSEGAKIYEYIYKTWIPNSKYLIDERPHFALMGEKYKNNDQNSEEEIWIPIRNKS